MQRPLRSRMATVPVSSQARASAGVNASLLGTVKRQDGRLRATYAGRPLYSYLGDRKPLQILCQNVAQFGGTWLVVRTSGTLVRRGPPSLLSN